MATKTKTENKTEATANKKRTTTKKTATKKPTAKVKPKTTKKAVANLTLDAAFEEVSNQYGEMLSALTNTKIKLDVMLGQILKGLYIVGITPDKIIKKCEQMFQAVRKGE